MSIIELLRAGGIVSIPLLVFSLITVALIIERFWFWKRIKSREKVLVKEVLKIYRSDCVTAISMLRKNADLPMARIFLESLELENPNAIEFRLALETATQAELPLLKRFNTFFQTVITIAPLLGLLGTILGLIQSFSSLDLGNTGGTNAAGVTGGISEALISTVMGLVVAIVTLMFANVFRSFYLRQIALIQEYGGQLELLYRRFYEEKGEKSYANT
ncbi:MotA/TolQ/ExbB proton channel family protein [Geminocystis sp. NIES-3709]|uniref:MotA/TolQ/ExbB proton channel family protein n=1 Tax=Geminocystis sp. NIES-3709 TaxID=1617448 RepID=UPI0005FC87CC|nr:MotA/TolQ/ExbB proton channel family protein [Geminocystis sp. NIES-3709]BAQ65366.1 ferric siderophore transport system [Geminocystis sp. NIES-3709]